MKIGFSEGALRLCVMIIWRSIAGVAVVVLVIAAPDETVCWRGDLKISGVRATQEK